MDRRVGHKTGLMTGSFERIEVITGVARRRRWSVEEKLRIIAESLAGGASVSLVAQRHGLRSNQLFKWRKLAREGAFGAFAGDACFVPVRVAEDGGPPRLSPLERTSHKPSLMTNPSIHHHGGLSGRSDVRIQGPKVRCFVPGTASSESSVRRPCRARGGALGRR